MQLILKIVVDVFIRTIELILTGQIDIIQIFDAIING